MNKKSRCIRVDKEVRSLIEGRRDFLTIQRNKKVSRSDALRNLLEEHGLVIPRPIDIKTVDTPPVS